jgi:hypothetical protein
MSNDPTAEQIRNTCFYDPDTGLFVRVMKKTWKGNWKPCYSIPKSKTAYGYFQMNVNGWPYLVHRLIFLYMTGKFPEHDVDHINGDRTDNRWCNLRQVSRQDNLRNRGLGRRNTSGHLGISYDKEKKKYHAYIGIGDGERINIGYFVTLDDAISARKQAEKDYGYHENHSTREGWRG